MGQENNQEIKQPTYPQNYQEEMFCPFCGEKNSSQGEFCMRCGQRLRSVPSTIVVYAPPRIDRDSGSALVYAPPKPPKKSLLQRIFKRKG